MKNKFLLLALLLSSCSHIKPIVKEVVGEKIQSTIPAASPTASPSPTPAIAEKVLSIVYDPIIGAPEEKKFIKEGEDQANAVLKSDCFKSAVLAAQFTENQSLTNAQIYQKFVDASPMKVGIAMFSGSWLENHKWHTVAYEGNPIAMNRYFVDSASYVGSTSLHEGFGHGLNFRHDYNKNYATSKTIPYTLNRIFDKCAKALGYRIDY